VPGEPYEIVVKRDGEAIEWWCATATAPAIARLKVVMRRQELETHRPADCYAATGTIFRETPRVADPSLIRSKEAA
jgi:hypothetical protein